MKKKINIGLIGYGVIGKRRIKSLPNQFNLIACSDPYIKLNKINLNQKNIYITKNWKKLINIKSLNAVIICTTLNGSNKLLYLQALIILKDFCKWVFNKLMLYLLK